MKNFAINVLSQIEPCCCEGQIQIKSYSESFKMSLRTWNLAEYQKQWSEGLKRIQTHDQSCLIANIQATEHTLIDWWVLYKENHIVYVQNELITDIYLQLFLQRGPFNSQTCYEFIEPRYTMTENGVKISEWSFTL